MALIPSFRRVLKSDIKDAPDWFSIFLITFNNFCDSVVQGFSKGLTFNENIDSDIRQIQFNTSASYSSGDFTPIVFQPSMKNAPQGLLLLQVSVNNEAYAPLTSPVFVSWRRTNAGISIDYVTGLADSKSYTIRILVI